MNAPERLPLTAQRSAIKGAEHIPVQLIMPSPSNPRYRQHDTAALQLAWHLNDLATSIKNIGQISPILVRPRLDRMVLGDDGAYTPIDAKRDGGPLYELVAGERRWRATQLAGLDTVMALVRQMTDFEVCELQVVENMQRDDLHPLEEAAGYRRLLRDKAGDAGYANVDDLAERLGKSRRYVYNRLALCDLGDEGRAAFYEGHINASVAMLIARMKDKAEQAEATTKIVQGFGGEPFSFRSASDYLKREFMLELRKATFDIAAQYDVAGPCTACPRRSGANPDLFTDVGSSDMCQDSKCYQAKEAEAKLRMLDSARLAGHTVLSGAEALKVMQNPAYNWLNGHVNFDAPCTGYTDSEKPLNEILGNGFKEVVYLDHPQGKVVRVLPEAAAEKALRGKGLLRAPRPQPASPNKQAAKALRPMNAKDLAAEIANRAEINFGQRLFSELHGLVTTDAQLPTLALRMAVQRLTGDLSHEAVQLLYTASDWVPPKNSLMHADLDARIKRAAPRDLANLLVLCLVVEECSDSYGLFAAMGQRGDTTDMLRLADEYSVDLQALRKLAEAAAAVEVQADQDARTAAAENAAKPVVKPAKTKPTQRIPAAAQGAKSTPAEPENTPEKALAKALATDGAVAPEKKNQKDATAKLHAIKGSASKATAQAKELDQKDKPATPAAQHPYLSPEAAWPFPEDEV